MNYRSRLFACVLPILLMILISIPVVAQFNASLQGTITDSTGAVIPNARVVATNQETGVKHETVSGAQGFFRIGALPPGKYTIAIEAATFGKTATTDILVSAEAPRTFNASLKAKQSSETVTVSDVSTGVEMATANVASTLNGESITKLPSSGRDVYDLVRMAPGVFGDASRTSSGNAVGLVNNTGPNGSASAIFQTENQVQISGAGQRVSANSYQVDGVSVNSLEYGGAAILTPNLESIKEVSVTTGSYSAEDGRNSGVQVKTVSQTGANTWHGSAFFKDAEPGYNAFARWGGPNTADTPARNEEKNHQFAGSLGGSIIKNKLFFFASYEGLRQSNTTLTSQYIATPQFTAAVIAQRAGTPIATILGSSGFTPRVKHVLAPDTATCTGMGNYNNGANQNCQIVGTGYDLGSLYGSYGTFVPVYNANNTTGGGFDGVPDVEQASIYSPSKKQGNQYNGRLDYSRGKDNFALSTYITVFNSTAGDASTGAMPAADVNMKPVSPMMTLLWNRSISPTWLNEARVNVSRWSFDQLSSNSGVNWGIPNLKVEDMKSMSNLFFGASRSEGTPGIFAQNQYEFRDVATHMVGNHALKAGFEFRREQDNNNLLGGARPLYSFGTVWNLANGTPIYEGINANPLTGGSADAQLHFRSTDIGIFLQDDWKVRRNLTLNIGLRWEYFAPLTDAHDQTANLALGSGPGLTTASIKLGGALTNKDLNNVAPRVGFSWSPYTDNKFVVRGGFGVAYNRIPNSLFENTHGNPPNFARYGLCCNTSSQDWGKPDNAPITFVTGSSKRPDSYPVNTGLAGGINAATNLPNSGGVEIWSADPNTRTPYTYSYSLDTQYELPQHMIATLGYQGSISHKLIRIVNQVFLQSAGNTNPAIAQDYLPMDDVNSSFNSLNVAVRRGYSSGVQFDAKYRWSKSLDTLSNEGPGGSANQDYPINQKYMKGPSDFDATHFIVGSIIYKLPFYKGRSDAAGLLMGGWEVSSIYTWHSGFPWTPESYTNSLLLPTEVTIGPVRPYKQVKAAKTSADTSTFMKKGGNFPGAGNNAATYFDFTHQLSLTTPPGIGRNSFRGPRFSSFDATLGKNIPLGRLHLPEAANLDLRLNVFNVFNKLNLNDFGYASNSTLVENADFGMATGAKAGRVAEIQARFSF